MNMEKGRARQHLTDSSYMKEEAGLESLNAEESSREMIARGTAAPTADAAHPPGDRMSSSDNPSSEDTPLSSKPPLSYIALIAKVLLSSPSQKLNLASIYRAMEQQFPYLRSRGPGWRNSVRHNLSVNDCFVKVSRCEDGRGHYWGVHRAHLRDFQQGNFRLYRKAKGRRRREKERCDKVAGCLAWMETSRFLGRLYGSRTLCCVEPRCPLQEPRGYQTDWTLPRYPPWVQPPSCVPHYCSPEMLLDSQCRAAAGRGHATHHMAHRLTELARKGMKASCDSRFMTLPVQELRFPACCVSPTFKELIKPLPYKTFNF